MTRKTSTPFLIPCLLLLLAFALRTLSLTAQSFWIDEVYAVWFVNRPWHEALRIIITPDNNGPFYFALLWGWLRLGGNSDFAVRLLSVFFSILSIAATWRLGKHWFGKRIAHLAALWMALAPFTVWFGQEAKMYALYMFLAALSTLLLSKALANSRWQLWLGYGLSFNLLGYTHFFSAFLLAVQGLLALIAPGSGKRGRLGYLMTMAAMTLPYLPLLRFVWAILPEFQMHDPSKYYVPFWDMWRQLLLEFSFRTGPWTYPALRLMGVGVFLLLGLVEAWRRQRRLSLWLITLFLLPPLIFYPISRIISVFTPKYFSGLVPFFFLLLALAIAALRRWHPWLALVTCSGLLVIAGQMQLRDVTDPAFQRTDWRYVARYLDTHGSTDDIIVVYTDYMDRVLSRYYHGPMPIFAYPYAPKTPEPLYERLQAEGFARLWLVLHHDLIYAPDHRLIEAAGERFPKITAQHPTVGQIRLFGFSMNWRREHLPESATPIDLVFSNGMRLVGYQVDATRLPATERISHPPSNWIHLTTYWKREATATPEAFRLIGLLSDAHGGVWGRELHYFPTVFDFDPPAQWPPDAMIEAHLDVNLNPVTPPGVYRLQIALESEDGTRIPLATGETEALLTAIEIIR